MPNLKGKVAIITGAAKGIGRGIALGLAQKGVKVVMSDIDQVNLIKTEKLLKTINPSVISVQADVSSLEDSSRLFETSLKTFNQIDILINNVGINASGGILNLDFNQAKKVFETNLIGPFYLTHLAAKQMVEEKIPGSILFTSSTHARVTMLSPTYTATKAAI